MKFSNAIKTVLKIYQKYVKNTVWFGVNRFSFFLLFRFVLFCFLFKKNGEGSFRRSKVILLFCMTYSQEVDFFILSPHIWATFVALIPPSFTSLNLFEKFFRPL